MSASERYQILLTVISMTFVVMAAGLGLIVRITRRWTQVEDKLSAIADKIGGLVRDKDIEHEELDRKIEKVDNRIERHEAWHDEHPYMRS